MLWLQISFTKTKERLLFLYITKWIEGHVMYVVPFTSCNYISQCYVSNLLWVLQFHINLCLLLWSNYWLSCRVVGLVAFVLNYGLHWPIRWSLGWSLYPTSLPYQLKLKLSFSGYWEFGFFTLMFDSERLIWLKVQGYVLKIKF